MRITGWGELEMFLLTSNLLFHCHGETCRYEKCSGLVFKFHILCDKFVKYGHSRLLRFLVYYVIWFHVLSLGYYFGLSLIKILPIKQYTHEFTKFTEILPIIRIIVEIVPGSRNEDRFTLLFHEKFTHSSSPSVLNMDVELSNPHPRPGKVFVNRNSVIRQFNPNRFIF